ncbi:MAG: adenine deaminase [Epulopiscium sp. Nuni2H_MBin003]|nr:MAG: adenine deaminase [Epulopiscium sp. Nuni2H_MBin003]
MMLPSCVPATTWEDAGAVVDAKVMEEIIADDDILGLGEFMDYPNVVAAQQNVMDKILLAKKHNKIIDGHSPSLTGKELNAYAATRIKTDHECETVQDMQERMSRGMYAILRQGSACHDLRVLLKGLTKENSRRALLCTDDCQPKTILTLGHLDNHLRICVEEGIDPIMAIQMATVNAAECYGLSDRGAIAPGLRADIVLFEDLKDFKVTHMFIEGKQQASNGEYEGSVKKHDISSVFSKFAVKDFSKEKLKLKINSTKAYAIKIKTGGVVTEKVIVPVSTDEDNLFIYEPSQDVVKIAVIERHNNTGNVAVGLLAGYGMKKGAIAISISHDSHNIIAVGVNDDDMELAVKSLIAQHGGIVLVNDGKVIGEMPLVVAGIMSDRDGEWVSEKLTHLHDMAHSEFLISKDVEPIMTLCFMSLAVIPEIKITSRGIFDVTKFEFINIEA